ncbi:MAG: hypothetical protein GYA57_00680 [Myxococcales bacterium]|nr:hypothetical protein [Myxococcales bacterium]
MMAGVEAGAGRKRLRLELLIAGPPTARCKQLLAMMKELVVRYPDRVRLDVYEAGEAPSVTPTFGFQAAGKRKKVPSAFINGTLVASRDDPGDIDRLVAATEMELARGEAEWQA